MSSEALLASPLAPVCTRWVALVTLLLGCATGCHDRVLIGTERAGDPGVELPSPSDAGDDEPRADAGPESGEDDQDEDEDQNDQDDDATGDSNEGDGDGDAPDPDD